MHRSSKRVNVSRAARPSDRTFPSSRVIDSNLLTRSRQRSSLTTLSMINMTSCGSIVAAMDDTMAIVDLCLKHNNGAYNVAMPQLCIQIHQGTKEGGVGQDKCEIDVRGVEGRAVMAGVRT